MTTDPPSPARHALLIGNAAYADATFARLAVPTQDVCDLAAVLRNPAICGFDQAPTLLDQDKTACEAAIEELFCERRADDLLLLYFSGHGLLDDNGDLYLALADTRHDRPLSSALSADWLRKVMNRSPSRRQVLILDCCYSGAFGRAGSKGAAAAIGQPVASAATFDMQGYGRVALLSSTATQLSWEGGEVIGAEAHGRSLFTHYLVEGLRTGAAAPAREQIGIDDLYNYAHDRVLASQSRQTPQLWQDGSRTGSLIIARNPCPPPPPDPLPPALRAALNDPSHLTREGAVRELGRCIARADDTDRAGLIAALTAHRAGERHLDVREAIDEVLGCSGAPPLIRPLVTPPVKRKPGAPPAGPTRQATAPRWQRWLLLTLLLIVGGWAGRVGYEGWVERSSTAATPPATATPPQPFSIIQDRLKTKDTLGPRMIVLPKGCFQMGSPANEAGRDRDEVQHQACVEAFALGETEVTFDQYALFTQATQRDLPGDNGWGTGERPVIGVSWQDALAYADWLSQETGAHYRLPTEAEWEYAARATTTTARFWGDDPDQACAWANVYDETGKRENNFTWESHHCDDKFAQTAPVGSFKANPWGLKDMLGNVWEWTCSAYDGKGHVAATECVSKDYANSIALRGGSWYAPPAYVRAATRFWLAPDDRYFNLGFRLARTISP